MDLRLEWIVKLVKGAAVFLAIVILIAVVSVLILKRMNTFKTQGEITIPGVKWDLLIIRDEKGVPYIKADNLHGAVWGQGFAMAQDRLFQMQLNRLMAQGRISELAGEKAVPLDTRMRTLGFERAAKRHANILSSTDTEFFDHFCQGINAFIENRPNEIPLEFKIAGLNPEKWSPKDCLSILYFMAWSTSADMKNEIVALNLVDKLGLDKAGEIFPLNINPDDARVDTRRPGKSFKTFGKGFFDSPTLLAYLSDQPLLLGSNNWAVSSAGSKSGKPILANDPHLDARMLPGPWYPSAIITPKHRMVGVTIAGIPGMIVGRNSHVALGITNAYADVQDLFIERIDPENPDNYLEGVESIPFSKRLETLKIKDKSSETGFKEKKIIVRSTKRGPIISDVTDGLDGKAAVSIRWAPIEQMRPSIGLEKILKANSVNDVDKVVANLTSIVLNFVFADDQGNIGWRVSGSLPIRKINNSPVPLMASEAPDNWIGWIQEDQAPHSVNPERGWLGTCNHYTVPSDYPYYYTSYASPTYRYKRLSELLERNKLKAAEDHWGFQRDSKNVLAGELRAIFVKALKDDGSFGTMVEILEKWDLSDSADSPAPLIYHRLYERFAKKVFQDELGEDLCDRMLKNWYFWQERLTKMIMDNDSDWFDDKTTKSKVESRDDLIRSSAGEIKKELSDKFGADPLDWRWGKAHVIEFVNPLRRKGFGKKIFGAESFEMGGSVDTLYRAMYDFGKPSPVTITASLRMVADLGDGDKVLAVLPGGASARTFHSSFKNQLDEFMDGTIMYWWFSDEAIKEHTAHELRIKKP